MSKKIKVLISRHRCAIDEGEHFDRVIDEGYTPEGAPYSLPDEGGNNIWYQRFIKNKEETGEQVKQNV